MEKRTLTISVLEKLGLIERTEAGRVVCPFDDVHVDMHVGVAWAKAA